MFPVAVLSLLLAHDIHDLRLLLRQNTHGAHGPQAIRGGQALSGSTTGRGGTRSGSRAAEPMTERAPHSRPQNSGAPPPSTAMASAASSSFKEELMCPVCYDPFKDAVTLQCGHNFCRECVNRSWGYRGEQACPICQEVSPREALRTNHTLSNLVQMLRQEERRRARGGGGGEAALCALHQEEAKLFCLDDKEVLCAQCQASKQHDGHKVRPVAETAKDYRAKWKNMETSLKDKLKDFSTFKRTYDSIVKHNKAETIRIREQIKKEFLKLHEFLNNEEKDALSELEDEAKQKQTLVEEKIKKVLEDMGSLSLEINKLQAEMKESDVSFLMKHKNRKRRIACTVDEPEAVPAGTLIDVAHHLGSLQYKVWKKMVNAIKVVPFSFDPNTAAYQLKVSGDLTTVTQLIHPQLALGLANPERFILEPCLLGSRRFSKGRHSWEVEFCGTPEWRVGVTNQPSGQRMPFADACKNCWYIEKTAGLEDLKCWVSSPYGQLVNLKKKLNTVRVELDCDEGELSFYDEDQTLIYSFYKNFAEGVFPYFYLNNFSLAPKQSSLRLCPITISVPEDPMS
ncbi:E3 ubiquitin-protein ligase TRIM35 isoform X4 [Ambystoma mexicanum]|uniref:E3 ubiquitin-protein ligase TRIM35 isoform X4 n=1 Tax=Ambystoma mexicanum TaxID=8296 RepID=UPI0037E78B63